MSRIVRNLRELRFNPPMVLTLGFGIMILLGALLLNLGVMTNSGESVGFINALFTAGSATCVTGLVVVNTAEHWSIWGKLVILTLIQIGGLGIMTLATIFPIVMRRKIGITSRNIIKEQLNIDSRAGLVKLLKYVVSFTLFVELIGAILLSTRLIPKYGTMTGIWYSIFHSISAFCNAGFDIFGDSIESFVTDPVVNFTIMALVIIGGIGFVVTQELIRERNFNRISVHGKLALTVSGILIVFGTLILLLIEFNNDATIANLSFGGKTLASLFQSVITRTAGFNSVNISSIRDSSVIIMIILMFIGGSPGSTAGGLKTTTFGVLVASMISTIRGEDDVVIFKKKINTRIIQKALALVMISISIIMVISFMLTITEEFAYINVLFEVVSAYGTVGLSTGITSYLSDFGKLIITFTMYAGRVGPLTMAFAFGRKRHNTKLDYPEANINVG